MTTSDLDVTWRVSSYSGNGGGDCVEAGPFVDGSARYAVRDSKHQTGPVLTYPASSWLAFLTATKSGTFDLPT